MNKILIKGLPLGDTLKLAQMIEQLEQDGWELVTVGSAVFDTVLDDSDEFVNVMQALHYFRRVS